MTKKLTRIINPPEAKIDIQNQYTSMGKAYGNQRYMIIINNCAFTGLKGGKKPDSLRSIIGGYAI
jgi:hypothetical protein